MNESKSKKGAPRKSLLQGALLGAVATVLIGFTIGGWTLGRSAEMMATEAHKEGGVNALAPLCVEKIESSADVEKHRVALKDKTSFQRSSYVEENGFSTFHGNEKPTPGVSLACAKLLSAAS